MDVLHGVEVADPYRWLEAGDDAAVQAFTEAQNAHARRHLDGLPRREQLNERLIALLRASTSTACGVARDRVFSLDRWGDHDQAVLVWRDAHERGDRTLLVDPHAMLNDDTAALDWYEPSRDGDLVAFGVSTGGDERSTLRVIDIVTGELTSDEIAETRAASVAWAPDGSAFAYTRYPPGDEYNRTVWWHELGADPDDDAPVFDDLPDKTAWPMVSLSDDGSWLLVHVMLGLSQTDVHLFDCSSDEWTTVIQGEDATTFLQVVGNDLVGTTTLDADRGRVVRTSIETPTTDHWETLVPERDVVIDGLVRAGDRLLLASTRRAVAVLEEVAADDGAVRSIELPGLGSFGGLSGSDESPVAFFSYNSFTRPSTLLRWTPDAVVEWSESDDSIAADGYQLEQVEYPSSDGARVPMLLLSAAGTEPSAATPTILTAYGGFAISLSPAFSPLATAWCDSGGLFAVANIRGGGELGETWHKAGMRENKQQSFDDFYAAADWLVAEGRTSRDKLAIRGGSNGGLLMGAAMTQRPDLSAAVHCAVPLLDMIRFPSFLIAELWVPEYGDPSVAEEFGWLHAYSPYHRVVDGTCYPAALITTAEEDSRVDPAHARKMAARLQAATSCGHERPIVLHIETRAGHGQGKPVGKQADEATDVLAFFHHHLASN